MEQITLNVKTRKDVGKKVRAIKSQGLIPAVLYGHDTENIPLEVSYNLFVKVWKKAGESSFVDLCVDEKSAVKVLIHDYQTEPLSGNISHVDFYKINMKEKIHVPIALHFVNESPAEKSLGGTLLTKLEHIQAKCLPKDLVNHVDVELSVLKTFNDVIHVKDISVPEGIEILTHGDDVVAKVVPPRTEEELKALEEKPEGDISQVKVEGAEGKLQEAGVEGSATGKVLAGKASAGKGSKEEGQEEKHEQKTQKKAQKNK